MCSGITSCRVLDGELLYTKILEVNLFAFAYRLSHEDFPPTNGTLHLRVSLLQMYDVQFAYESRTANFSSYLGLLFCAPIGSLYKVHLKPTIVYAN